MPPTRTRRPGLAVVTRPGRPGFYIRGTIRGTSVFESAGTDDRQLAEEYRATRAAQLYRGAIHGTRAPVTFAAAVVSYMEAEARGRAVKNAVAKLLKQFGPGALVHDIDQEAIDRAAKAICRSGSKPATILRQVIVPTRAILTHAHERGWCDRPAIKAPRVKAGRRTDWMTPAEAEGMIAAASPHLRPLLAFLFCTGARLGEALSLDWQDVTLAHARCTLRETKNEDDRIVELPPRIVAALANLPGDRAGRVFRTREGAAYRETETERHGAYGGQIRRAFGTALRRAGITRHLTPHHCRHTWATWHYAMHRDPMRLRSDGGWRSISQVERYAKLAPPEIADEIRRFLGLPTGANSVPGPNRGTQNVDVA